MNVYVARQPIFDRQRRIYGYELLFRDGFANAFPDIDGDVATSRLLSNTFLTIGLDRLSPGHRVFINFTAELICRRVPTLFPSDRLVVEILEDVKALPEVVEACRDLVAKGYRLALDDFLYRPDLTPLIRLAKIIKIDFRATIPASSRKLIEALQPSGTAFLAEKVETPGEFQEACDLGYRYFQGYFFARPEVVEGRDIPSDKFNWVQIAAEVNRPDFAMEKVERFLASDVSAAYKLLRYINSAYFGRPETITSIRQALLLLGQQEVRRFVSLFALANLSAGKPGELMRTAIIRGHFCELIGAAAGGRQDGAELFMLGLFSLIDAMLDSPMARVMEQLPLGERIKRALVDADGVLADYLALVLAYEKMDEQRIVFLCSRLHFDQTKLPEMYFNALGWALGYDQADSGGPERT